MADVAMVLTCAAVIAGAAVVACSKKSPDQPKRPNAGSAVTTASATASAVTAQSSFLKGDKVISAPVAVMEVAGIGPRASFVDRDDDNVAFDLLGTVADGSSPLQTIPADNEIVYALRFLGEEKAFELASVARSKEVGLRRIVDKKTAESLLGRLHALDTPAPPLASEWDMRMRAVQVGNDLWEHLVLTRTLLARERDATFTPNHARLLTRELSFVVAELSTATARRPEDVSSEIRALFKR
jgi:RNA polymerase-interacting CarD/CdnL/TRCF family regulator